MLGFFLIAALDALKVKGSILIGILALTVIAILIRPRRSAASFDAAVDRPDLPAARHLRRARRRHPAGDPRLRARRGLRRHRHADRRRQARRSAHRGPGPHQPAARPRADGRPSAIVAGSMLGTSSTTAYVESASGVQAGGRTGLTALTSPSCSCWRCSSRRSRARSRPSPPRRRCSRRLPDDARARRHRLGRRRRVRAGGADRDHDALHLLDRQRPRLRLHQLRGASSC